MNYVEWLRVRGCLKWTAIVLVVCVAIVLFGRFTYLNIDVHSKMLAGVQIGDQSFAQFEASSKETTTKLPDGTVRTVIDNPAKGIRITVDDRGYWGKHFELFEKKPPHDAKVENVDFGDLHLKRVILPNGSLVTVDEGALVPEDLNYYFAFATLVAMIVATILGAPFARENEGHLELALAKPVSRIGFALQTIAADVAGIVAAFVMTVIFLMIGHTIFEAPNYTYGPTDTMVLAIGLAGAFAWYGMLNVSTASMKRSYGAVLGIAWPIALGLGGIAHAPLGDSALAAFVRSIGEAVLWLFPTKYLHFSFISGLGSEAHRQSLALSPQTDLVILACLALIYGAFAIYQWQRVEA